MKKEKDSDKKSGIGFGTIVLGILGAIAVFYLVVLITGWI